MVEILKPETLALFLMFSVPGIIALYFRAQFLAGRLPSVSEGAISYLTLSLVYHAIAFPIAQPLYLSGRIDGWFWAAWFALLFVAPAALGLLLGLNVRKGWTKKLVNRLGLSTVHPVKSAWDWRFGGCSECWVHVTLKDNTRWAGYLSAGSFMSSDPAERDLFIEYVYDAGEDGQTWIPRNSSVWIAHGELQSLEFLSAN
ncbi:DUF6338 family protein [Novosphingobium beihaiensis]|uniref:DUF6338 family protein n=1 Tax=Novosphingobium beihaiensis TaxID=2930389 RepID=A0ABT0BJS1_9SPHN|nr:DUF6338 family protein [Novosphingobium beihaiensis]MCJ2185285.1 DUF6338 family protein [Novosphingobium beihaiensis]